MEFRGQPNPNYLFVLEATVLWTVETPSTNFVRNRTLALLNMPSFNDTTMNCTTREFIKTVLTYKMSIHSATTANNMCAQ